METARDVVTPEELRRRLAECGISQRKFAQAAGLDAPQVSTILRGAPFGPVRRAKIERAIEELKLYEVEGEQVATPGTFRVLREGRDVE